MSQTYPYAFHVALDGGGLSGAEGRAGVGCFRYDPVTRRHRFDVRYFPGAAGGHAVMLNPSRTVGYLGNFSQHLLFYDPGDLSELDRVSTLAYESTDHTIRSSTHLVWLDDEQFVTTVGENMYQFDLRSLGKGDVLGPHGLGIPHSLQRSAGGRHIVYGGIDHPRRGEAREVGIFDLQTGTARRVELPATCWHVAAHPTRDVLYAVTSRVVPRDGWDYQDWAMGYLREYVFEIDIETGAIIRHWAAAREIPAHLSSDITISDTELIFCSGGSGTVILVDLETFSDFRGIDEHPGLLRQFRHPRQIWQSSKDAFGRGTLLGSGRHFAAGLQVTRGALLDSMHSAQVSADSSLLFTANRGLNQITVYNYPELTIRQRVQLPPIQEVVRGLPRRSDPRLGFHHSYLVSPEPKPVP